MQSNISPSHTTEQLKEILDGMRKASAAFYHSAIRLDNHPFIEFTGLINEYIKCCEAAMKNGIDFTQCSKHSGMGLPMETFEVQYVNEKLECIFTGKSVMEQKERGGE